MNMAAPKILALDSSPLLINNILSKVDGDKNSQDDVESFVYSQKLNLKKALLIENDKKISDMVVLQSYHLANIPSCKMDKIMSFIVEDIKDSTIVTSSGRIHFQNENVILVYKEVEDDVLDFTLYIPKVKIKTYEKLIEKFKNFK